jgi:hypothetical protein
LKKWIIGKSDKRDVVRAPLLEMTSSFKEHNSYFSLNTEFMCFEKKRCCGKKEMSSPLQLLFGNHKEHVAPLYCFEELIRTAKRYVMAGGILFL